MNSRHLSYLNINTRWIFIVHTGSIRRLQAYCCVLDFMSFFLCTFFVGLAPNYFDNYDGRDVVLHQVLCRRRRLLIRTQ